LLHRYRVHRTTENVKFHVRQTHCCQKRVCQTLSLILVSIKKQFWQIYIFFTCKCFLVRGWVGTCYADGWCIPWEGSRVTRRLKRKSPNFCKCGLNISQNTNKLKIKYISIHSLLNVKISTANHVLNCSIV